MPFADEVQACTWHTNEIGAHTFTWHALTTIASISTVTRPAISFTVSVISQFMDSPYDSH